MSVEEVEQIRRTAQAPISLEKPVGDDEESEFGHYLEDDSVPGPDELTGLTLRNEAPDPAPPPRAERERRVIELRFGLNGGMPTDARRGGPGVQRHPRARPPDREPRAQEVGAARRGEAPRRRA